MSREELLESAALDAFGMLDDYEEALFTRSFHHAPAATQKEVLELQAELVSDNILLPEANPDPILRTRVLEAVAVAIEQETAELEPLATIGRPRPTAAERDRRLVFSASGHFWRAAAFVLLACVVVVLYYWNQVVQQNLELARLVLTNTTETQLRLERLVGPTAKDFIFDRTAAHIVLDSTNPADNAHAALYIKEGTGQALLMIEGLAATSSPEYILRAVENGNVREVERFASLGRFTGIDVSINGLALDLKNTAWQITDQTGKILLLSI